MQACGLRNRSDYVWMEAQRSFIGCARVFLARKLYYSMNFAPRLRMNWIFLPFATPGAAPVILGARYGGARTSQTACGSL